MDMFILKTDIPTRAAEETTIIPLGRRVFLLSSPSVFPPRALLAHYKSIRNSYSLLGGYSHLCEISSFRESGFSELHMLNNVIEGFGILKKFSVRARFFGFCLES